MIEVLIHLACASVPAAEVRVIVLFGVIVIAKVLAALLPQPLFAVTLKVPLPVGMSVQLVPVPIRVPAPLYNQV